MKKNIFCVLLVLFCCINIEAKPYRSCIEREFLIEALSKDSAFQALSAQRDFLKNDFQEYLVKLDAKKYPEHAELREAEEYVKNANFGDKDGASDYPVPVDWEETILLWIFLALVVVFCICLAILTFRAPNNEGVGVSLGLTFGAVFSIWCLIADVQGTYLAIEIHECKTKIIPELKATIKSKKDNDATFLFKKDTLSNVEQKINIVEKRVLNSVQKEVDAKFAKEIRKFEADMRKLSFRKKLRVLGFSWEKQKDTPEYGKLEGSSSASGSSTVILGIGGGEISGSGSIKGEYKGRVLGEEYKFLHIILTDNSYHVIDASNNGKWRMIEKGVLLRYEKNYTDYNQCTTVLEPLYNE